MTCEKVTLGTKLSQLLLQLLDLLRTFEIIGGSHERGTVRGDIGDCFRPGLMKTRGKDGSRVEGG